MTWSETPFVRISSTICLKLSEEKQLASIFSEYGLKLNYKSYLLIHFGFLLENGFFQ